MEHDSEFLRFLKAQWGMFSFVEDAVRSSFKSAEVRELEEKIAEHDCHAGPESGCECSKWIAELAKLRGIKIYDKKQ